MLIKVLKIARSEPEVRFGYEQFGAPLISLVISLVSCIFVIYVLTHAIEWYQDSVIAKKMTEKPLNFQKKYEQG